MSDKFFKKPIINSPYEYPAKHWELDENGIPTHQIKSIRRPSDFITPIPKARNQTRAQQELNLDGGLGISSDDQKYDSTSIINSVRSQVDRWRNIENPQNWGVTPETTRLLQHWRHHRFSSIRPFFSGSPVLNHRTSVLLSGTPFLVAMLTSVPTRYDSFGGFSSSLVGHVYAYRHAPLTI